MSSLLGQVQTKLKEGGMEDSDLIGDSSLGYSKHGHLQLRGNNRSSIDDPV